MSNGGASPMRADSVKILGQPHTLECRMTGSSSLQPSRPFPCELLFLGQSHYTPRVYQAKEVSPFLAYPVKASTQI